jgi:O-antigen/teichoic acid export membrane protein
MPVFLRRRPQDMARLARVALIPALLTSTVAAVAVFIYAPQLVPIFVHHAHRSRSIAAGTTTDLRILACLIPAATATTVAVAGVRAWTAKVSVLINSVVIPLARPLLFGGFLLIGMTARLATLAWALPVGAGALIAVYSLVARIRSEPRYREAVRAHSNRRPIAREFWSFSVPRTFGAVFQILISYIDVLFVGGLLSSRDAAAYSIASRYIVYGTFALQAVSMAVAPQLSRLIDARHRDGLNSVYQSSACWAMVASWPVLIVLAVFAPLFMSIFGAGYGIAASALSVLALAMLVNTGTGSTGVLLLMSGRSGLMLAFLAAGLGANVGLNLWLIPAHGPFGGLVGASIAWMVTILIMAIGPTIAIWRINGVLPFSRGWVVAALASGACFGILGLATRLVFGVRVVSFAVFAVVSTAAYAAVLFKWRQDLNVDAFGSLFGRFVRRFRVGKAT